jgi:hypothetical protein
MWILINLGDCHGSELTQKMSRTRFRNPDPLYCLPHEAWVLSIQHYARAQPEGPLPLLDVSRSWQKNLLSTPEVWTTIHFDGGHDELCRVECFFYLSRSLLVDLVVGSNSAVIDPVLLKYRKRIQSLIFLAEWSTMYPTSEISWFSSKLGVCTYPNLVYIYLTSPMDDKVMVTTRLLKACPALRAIHGASIGRDSVGGLGL